MGLSPSPSITSPLLSLALPCLALSPPPSLSSFSLVNVTHLIPSQIIDRVGSSDRHHQLQKKLMPIFR